MIGDILSEYDGGLARICEGRSPFCRQPITVELMQNKLEADTEREVGGPEIGLGISRGLSPATCGS